MSLQLSDYTDPLYSEKEMLADSSEIQKCFLNRFNCDRS